MTDYNDGLWHGWNGGECPVHPESLVDVRFLDEYPIGELRPGKHWLWDHADNIGDIIAFRVVKAHHEPREAWAFASRLYDTKAGAEVARERCTQAFPDFGVDKLPITHWREVLE